jgi:ATP-dependent Lhr-like helicase
VTENPFYRLAPFIREYIYTHGWNELRDVQVQACQVLFETDSHLLLAAGTASGKTEAAFLPVLTLLQENPPTTIGALYIGPLKALINDQFFRLEDLLKEADIPVWHWHGDVSQSQKAKLVKNPRGVLQITPESLESLLINKSTMLVRMFGDLQFIIVDEVHAFMGSDRGRQVLCQLERLTKFILKPPRRIGLSATLGDYKQAEDWLRSGTERPVITPKVQTGQQKVRVAVEHFFLGQEVHQKSRKEKESKKATDRTAENNEYENYIFHHSKGRKCLIFTNNRAEAESIVAGLRRIAEKEKSPDFFHIHHGSISAPLREAAENAMREAYSPAVTAATVTLELGIDIGQLERVIQLGAPFSVSSFVQRLGRSGRRNNPAEMWFVCAEDLPTGKELLPGQLPWTLLQAIAIIQLYVEKRWIEPVHQIKYPFSLLYHQTMSTLAGMGELAPPALAQRILTLSPFRSISQDDFKDFLLHLIEIDHIQKTEERGLIIGLTGEKVVRNFRFYAVFPDNEEFAVRDESKEIGSIIMPPPPGERFALAGRTWEVVDIDLKRKIVVAKQVKGKAPASWFGSGGAVHTKILQKMRQVLFESVEYPYLQEKARQRLKEARWLARHSGLNKNIVLPLSGDTYCLFPWIGTIGFRTLERCLRFAYKDQIGIRRVEGFSPYFFVISAKGNIENLPRAIGDAVKGDVTRESLLGEKEAPQMEKYDEFVPPHLLRKAFVNDYLDLVELESTFTQQMSDLT